MAGQLSTIRLSRYDAQPWGFRLQGGLDFGTPLIVQKVNGGSLAEQAGLLAGDALLKVNNVDVYNMRHKDAQDLIVRSGNSFDITIQRGGSVWRPQVTPTGSLPSPSSHIANSVPTVTKTSLSHKPQEVRHIGSGYNSAARPFSSVNGSDGQVKSIVNKQYNTPVGIYSEEAIAETLSAQAEVLAGGVLGVNFKKNEKIYNAANSEVLKMLHEQENDPEPDTQGPASPVTKHVTAPIDRPKAPNTGGLPTGQNICAECERLIVGVFVRIKDKNLHSECFKCATCGTNLKNQGYFNFNNKLYCDIHARLAAMNNPPKGTEGYTPVPIKPATKLSASTISAALDSHTQHNGSGLNTGYGGPKPFNSSPMSPPMRGPQSPSTYPPPTSVQSWDQPRSQPKPQVNPYATLPRTTGHSQGNTNLAPAPSLPAIADDNPQISRKVGDADSFDLPPPPPPLPGALSTVDSQSQAVKPVKTVSTTGNRTAKPFRPGLATEMLTSTLEKVDINDKQKFRDEAGKIISAMLESRLAQQTNQSLTKDLDTDHPMKKIIDVCDKPQPNQHSVDVSGEANGKQTAGLTLEVSPDGKILSGSPTEFGPSESVVYRNKSTNPTGKRELSTHAFDRRSYIDTNSNNQETSNPEVNGNTENTTTLVSDLKDGKEPVCCQCNTKITRGPFITALGRIWCPDHFVCVNANCRRPLQDIGFVEEKGELYCEFCFERYLAPTCSKCANKIKGDCLNAIGKHYHPECFTCSYCGKLFGNSPFFLEEGEPYCEADWNELFTTKCFACGFPVEAGDRWVEALNHNYHSQCFNCTMCKKNLEGQSFYNKGGRPFCKNHAR